MAWGLDKDKLRRNAEEAKSFWQVARGNEPAGWENMTGRPFRVPPAQPPAEPGEAAAPSRDEIELALAELSLRQRIAVFRQNRQAARG